MAKYLNLTGLQTLWTKIKAVFAPKENGVYYVPGTSGYANWSANTYYAVGANVVNPSGECWTCKTAHTSGSSWSSTNWNRISAVALTGTIDGVTALYAGLKIAYRFQVLGGEGSTTLNVNNLGAKTITRGTGAFYRWTIGRNGVAILVYDGSAWRFGDYDSNDQYVLPDAYCSTAAGTQAKAAISIGFSYSRHNNIPFRIYFTNANTYNGNLTLNVNSQGAKPLWINGSASSSSNKTIAIGVYWCYYDGTQFQLWTDKSLWAYKYRGDGSSLTETFTAASSRANIASGESNATIFGKIAKWFSDLKALAFKDKVGTGDVESGTYGISISGNAATATNAGTGGNLATAVSNSHTHSNKSFLDSISFDGSTTTKALTPKGTFEAFAKSGDITTAIQALEVSSVGGDGKYISAISETDGKISATVTTMDTTPTASSTKAVTSGGVKSALNGKANTTSFYSAMVGTSSSVSNWVKIDWGSYRAGRAAIAVEYGCENGSSSGSYKIAFFKAANSNITNASYRVTSLGNKSNVPRVSYSGTAFYLGLPSNGNLSWNVSIQIAADNAPTISQVASTDSGLSSATSKTPNSYAIETSSGYGGDILMGSGASNTLERVLSYKVELVLQDGGAAQSGWKLCVSDSVGSDDQTIYFT